MGHAISDNYVAVLGLQAACMHESSRVPVIGVGNAKVNNAKHFRHRRVLGLLLLGSSAWKGLEILREPLQVRSTGVSCFSEFHVAMQESPKRFLQVFTSADPNTAFLDAKTALLESEDSNLPRFLLQCLEELSVDCPSAAVPAVPRFMVGQLARLAQNSNRPMARPADDEILDLAIRLWRLPAKSSAMALLSIWQIRGKNIKAGAQNK